jgi:ketosteroid isomerase-like protein
MTIDVEETARMSHDDVQQWLDRYVAAWRSYDPAAIADLFAEEATYRYHPWDDPITGREAIVANWLDDRDEPTSWDAWYRPYAVDGERASVVGESRYTNPDGTLRDLYYNHWTLEFDADGRCVDFVEYFMALPKRLKAGH